MSAQERNVTPLTGSQPDTPDPLVRAEAAMSAAIGEFERLDHDAAAHSNGRVVAELIEAREDIRSEYRRTYPTSDDPKHPLSLIGTLNRAAEYLEAGEIEDAKAAISGCYRKARESQSENAPTPAKIPACIIGDLLHGTDRELGCYINVAGEAHRRHAVREALLNARALTDAISSLDHESVADFTAEQLARMANTMLQRVEHLEAEGSSDE